MFPSLLLSLIALPFVTADVPPFQNSEEYQFGHYGAYPKQRFYSDPDVIAPVPNVITPQQNGASPNEFVTWSPHGDDVPQLGPQILDAETLSMVWQGPRFQEDNFGVTKQTCNGSDYLVWWSGTNIEGRAAGHFYIFNSTYHSVWNISSIGLKLADAHDVFITPDCHAIITVNEPKPYELEDFHLADNSWLLDSYFQEIDLATNELVFQWRASDHIDAIDSLWLPWIKGWDAGWQGVNKNDAWDFFHINSVEKDWKGNYLISARHMNSLYYIDGVSGAVKWTLGGKKNEFKDLNDGYATDFAWQHHARWANEDLTLISVFDDRNCRYIKSPDRVSRGALISLDFEVMTASLAGSYRAPSHIEAFRKGGMQVLPNKNVLLGFGNEPAFTEYLPNGTIVWDVRMGPVMAGFDRETADNYRSYKLDWEGRPHWGPKIALGPTFNASRAISLKGQKKIHLWDSHTANDTVYFSWNGATEVKQWMLFSAQNPLELDSMANLHTVVNKTGFETGFWMGGNTTRYVRAVAISGDEEFLGATPILDLKTSETWNSLLELLRAHRSQWEDGSENAVLDKAVVELLEEDSLVALKEEWDALKHKDEHKAVLFGLGIVAVVVVFGLLGWLGWRSLVAAFERKYRDGYAVVKDVEGGVDGEKTDADGAGTKERENRGEKPRFELSIETTA